MKLELVDVYPRGREPYQSRSDLPEVCEEATELVKEIGSIFSNQPDLDGVLFFAKPDLTVIFVYPPNQTVYPKRCNFEVRNMKGEILLCGIGSQIRRRKVVGLIHKTQDPSLFANVVLYLE